MYEAELKLINRRLFETEAALEQTADKARYEQLKAEKAALLLAKEAIEKARPALVIEYVVKEERVKVGSGYWNKGTTVSKCPRCGIFVPLRAKYCIECGQAVTRVKEFNTTNVVKEKELL